MEDGQLSDSDSDMTVTPSDTPLQVLVNVKGGRVVLGPARSRGRSGGAGGGGGGSGLCISRRGGAPEACGLLEAACGGFFSAFHAPLCRAPHSCAAGLSRSADFAEHVVTGDVRPKQLLELIFNLSR